jgi:hypothetical protein
MAIILYRQDNGAPTTFVHAVDAKESLASGDYSASAPSQPKKPIVSEKVEAKVIAAPIVVAEKEVDPVVVEKEVKAIVKPTPRIIRK